MLSVTRVTSTQAPTDVTPKSEGIEPPFLHASGIQAGSFIKSSNILLNVALSDTGVSKIFEEAMQRRMKLGRRRKENQSGRIGDREVFYEEHVSWVEEMCSICL